MSVKRISDLPELKTVYGKTVQNGHLLSNELSNCLMEVSYVSEGKVYQSFYESLDVVLPDLDPVTVVSKGLQPATETILGGVKIGSNVCMNNDDQNVASILSVKTATTAVAGALKLPVDNTAYSVPESWFSNIQFLGLKNGQLTAYNMPKISVDNPINMSTFKDEMFDIMYPPGAIYITTSNVLPTNFQGIWRRCHPGMMLWNCDAITSSNNYINASAGGGASDRAFGRILCQREPTISCQNAGSHTHEVQSSSINGSVDCFHSGLGAGTAGTGGLARSYQPIINGSVSLSLKNSVTHAHSVVFNYDADANRSAGKNFMIRPESIGCSFWVRCNDNIKSSIISDIGANYQPGMSQADIDNAYQIWLVEPTHASTGNDRVQFYVYSRELKNNDTMASKIKLIGEIKGSESSNAAKWDSYMGVGYKDDVYHDLYSGDQNIEEPYRPS